MPLSSPLPPLLLLLSATTGLVDAVSVLGLGKVFTAVLVSYLLLVGSGPPAAALAWLAQKFLGISEGSRKAMELMLRYTVVGIGVMALAFHVGFNGTALLAMSASARIAAALGVAIHFICFRRLNATSPIRPMKSAEMGWDISPTFWSLTPARRDTWYRLDASSKTSAL